MCSPRSSAPSCWYWVCWPSSHRRISTRCMAGTQDSVRSWLASWCGPSVSRWAGQPVTPSIPLVTWVRESLTRCCRSPAREARTGAMRGFRWPDRSSADCSRRSCTRPGGRREVHPGLGPGHDELARHGVRPQRERRCVGAEGVSPDFSHAGVGRARRHGDLGHPAAHGDRSARQGRTDRRRHRRRRDHESAGNDRGLGARHGRTGGWDDELLDLFGVPRSVLPVVASSSEVYGETTLFAGGRAVPIAGIAGDQQAALFGQACTQPGMVKNTYGTGCFMLMNTGTKPIASKNNLLTTVAWRIGNRTEYALEASIFIAGAAVQWLRDGLGIIKSSSEVEALASQVDDTGRVYLVPAFAGLGAPHWDPYARGLLAGVTRGTTAAHVARAALEGIAFQVADVLRAMEADAKIKLKELRVDGGASANNLLMQFQSHLLGVPVVRPKVTETTALGAAYLAGLAVGYWQDQKQIAAQWQVDRRFTPGMKAPQRKQLDAGWRKALERSRRWEAEG